MSTSVITGVHGEVAVRTWAANSGDGPVVVLIHGVDGSSAAWEPLVEALRGAEGGAELTLHAVDLRGRGASAMAGPWGVAAHSADVAAVIEALTDSPVVLAGHSFGGHVAARVAADRADLIERLVLVDGGPPRLIPASMTGEELCDGALANILPHAEVKGCVGEAVSADFRSMVLDPAGARAVYSVGAPITLIRAENGVAPGLPAVIPDEVIAVLEGASLDLRHELIEGADHFSVLGEPSVALVKALLATT